MKIIKYLPSMTKSSLISSFLLSIAACTTTPQHSNVLIFGTNTKFALDASPTATSGVSVTVGYKREEAVWMPLLPNQHIDPSKSELKPAACTTNDCPKFEGTDVAGQKDTYSVLASFGAKFTGEADSDGKKAGAKGEIAQYFATGLAARLLAQHGSSLVNTNSTDTAIEGKLTNMRQELDELMDLLIDSTDPNKIDGAKRTAAFNKSPGKDIREARKNRVLNATTIQELRRAITAYPHESVAKPMLDTLNSK